MLDNVELRAKVESLEEKIQAYEVRIEHMKEEIRKLSVSRDNNTAPIRNDYEVLASFSDYCPPKKLWKVKKSEILQEELNFSANYHQDEIA